jgi:purine-binding chemotaxis protein CheW
VSVVLPVGDDLYAVTVGWVQEVVPAPPLTRLVTAPPVVLGLFNLRGEIVPLLDTAALLGLGAVGAVGPPAYAVVLRTRDGLGALAATGLPRRTRLGPHVGPSTLPGTVGTYKIEDRLVVLIDPTVLVSSELLRGPSVLAAGGRA